MGDEWDHIDDVLPVLESARAGKWTWVGNSRCKYLGLRIDTRSGQCIIMDRNGERISVADLRAQMDGAKGIPWPKK